MVHYGMESDAEGEASESKFHAHIICHYGSSTGRSEEELNLASQMAITDHGNIRSLPTMAL